MYYLMTLLFSEYEYFLLNISENFKINGVNDVDWECMCSIHSLTLWLSPKNLTVEEKLWLRLHI